MNTNRDTICAISTPSGVGGIAIVRVSGSNALEIVDSLFSGKRSIINTKGGQILYGTFANIDDVLVSVFRAPHSFTGEDTAEISCHGSIYIQQEILRSLTDHGCRLARAGEFTQRAFLNGKMDLTEAEAVADLIAAENKSAHDLALNHLRGGVSKQLYDLREKLLHFTSLIELELDFADHEELEFANRGELKQLSQLIEEHLSRLVASFKTGNALKNGISVAIIGPANAGKSTLLNALVGEERAIVSNIPGTTRDTIEDTILIDGTLFRFIDTAGIRLTSNEIERQGIDRSRKAAEKADIVLLVIDATDTSKEYNQYLEDINLSNKKVVRIYNKIDLLPTPHSSSIDEKDVMYISAKNGSIEPLKHLLATMYDSPDSHQTLISNVRHYEALQQALKAIKEVEKGLENNISGEFLSMDLQDCLNALGEITGQITSDEVLGNIFKHFCIGK